MNTISISSIGRPTLRIDPRFFQITLLIGYAIAAREWFHIERSHWIALLLVAWAIIFDQCLSKFYFKTTKSPLSSIIIGLSSSLLIDSIYPWVYFGSVSAAILSKAFVTYKGKHLFNPSNFGTVSALLLGYGFVSGSSSAFSGDYSPAIVFFSCGLAMVLLIGEYVISLTWICSFILFAVLRSWINGAPLFLKMLPIYGPSFLLFSFHMINDPGTTPRTRKFQIAFGVGVALIDAVLREKKVPNGAFYALIVMSCFLPWLRDQERKYSG